MGRDRDGAGQLVGQFWRDISTRLRPTNQVRPRSRAPFC